MKPTISHIYLPVRDVDESIDFYTKNLGFSLLREYEIGGRRSAYLQLNGILLELTLSDKTPSTDGRMELRIGLVVPDLDEAMKEVRAAGIEVPREPWQAQTFWGRQAQIKDVNGYTISLREYRAPDGPTFPDWQPEHDSVVRIR
jgi:predicted enzyme related to lactoylglutathione lyase